MKQIYKITNIKTNKSYIGIVIAEGKDYIKRFNEHMSGKGGVYLWDELQSGNSTIEDFIVELIEEGIQDDLYFKSKEEYYIGYFNTLYPNGYNGNKGNYIINTPITRAKANQTRIKNKKLGLHKPTGRPGFAIYRYSDGTIKKLPIDHPDVTNGIVKHINYDPECRTRKLQQDIQEQKEKNNGLTDKQLACSDKMKKIAKLYPKLESWQDGREKFRERMSKKEFTEKEKELYYKRRPDIVKQQWAKLSNEQKQDITKPGLDLMNTSYQCEHCGTVTNKGNYTRWHGSKCKKAPK